MFEITSILTPLPSTLSPDYSIREGMRFDDEPEEPGVVKIKEDQMPPSLPSPPANIDVFKVYRRFSDFEAFHMLLTNTTHSEYLLPPLPDKKFFLQNYIQ